MKYIKLRQEQIEIVESERDIEYLIQSFPSDDDTYPLCTKNTDIPWSKLINEETLIAAANNDMLYFAKHQLNNIIICNQYPLFIFLRDRLYDMIDDDDDFYEVINTKRTYGSGKFIITEESE